MKEKTILLKSSAYRNYRQNLAPREILVDGQMKYPVPGSDSSKARQKRDLKVKNLSPKILKIVFATEVIYVCRRTYMYM